MIRVTIYSRPDCHLCEMVERVLHHVQRTRPFELKVRNIDDDPSDYEQFKHDIPVVMVNGQEVARHQLTAEAFEAALALVPSPGTPGEG